MSNEGRQAEGDEPAKWDWKSWVNAFNSLVVSTGMFMWETVVYSSAAVMAGYGGPGGAAQLLQAAGVEHIQSGSTAPSPRSARVAPEEKPAGEEAV
jgi:hypothetical protein